jgi:tellurite resistance protein TehA-like permease
LRRESRNPAYFALVMATGIISIGLHLQGHAAISFALFVLNVAFYIVLAARTAMRVALFPKRVLSDFLDHGRSVGFFTTVAGTCVLGSQFLLIGGSSTIATSLWLFGIALWSVLTYAIFTCLTVKAKKPPLAQGINGGWLVSVVATQSVSVLGSQLSSIFESNREFTLFLSLTLWLGGSMLYIWIISLIFYRYTFFPLEPSDLAPPYWINMGAMAISTLAGTALIAATADSALLQQVLPFLKGFTIFFWATATWWIPMLIILGVWRHAYRRFPLRYDPLYWGAVFPLGMYATCTFRLSQAVNLPFLGAFASLFIWLALAAWEIAFLGMVGRILSRIQSSRRSMPL